MPNPHAPRPTDQATRRRRWWRVVALSALAQGLLLLIAWYAVQTRQHSVPSPTVVSVTQAPNEPSTPTISPTASSPPASTSSTATVTPQATTKPLKPAQARRHPSEDLGAQAPPALAPKHSSTAQPQHHSASPATADGASQSTPSSVEDTLQPTGAPLAPAHTAYQQLHSVPIATQTLSYRVQLQNGAQRADLPPARLTSTYLGAQRYTVALSNGTAQAGAGNFGWYATFLMTAQGPTPLDVGGGLYLKTDSAPIRSALGLNLHDDGQSWHWGKKANSGTRTHTQFLDRVSLIAYLQGALQRTAIRGTHEWILPLASERAIRDVAVTLSNSPAPDAGVNCQPCVHAQVRANLGEMNYWSVWYDGSRNWQPVMMKMGLGKGSERVLVLVAQ